MVLRLKFKGVGTYVLQQLHIEWGGTNEATGMWRDMKTVDFDAPDYMTHDDLVNAGYINSIFREERR